MRMMQLLDHDDDDDDDDDAADDDDDDDDGYPRTKWGVYFRTQNSKSRSP